MENFATLNDVITLFRALSADESSRASALLDVVSARLRYEAHKVGKDLDTMIVEEPYLAIVAKQVTVDIVGRTLNTSTKGDPVSQSTVSALGYSQSSTFLTPGGGLFIKKSELSALGLSRGRIGVIDTCSPA